MCLPGTARWQFAKISSFCRCKGEEVGKAKMGWTAALNLVLSSQRRWNSQKKQSLHTAAYLPCDISRGVADGKERFYIYILFLFYFIFVHFYFYFCMTDKLLALAKEAETLGGLRWLAVSRQGHDRKTGDVAQSYSVNPITLPVCIHFWHFRCSMTSHLALGWERKP